MSDEQKPDETITVDGMTFGSISDAMTEVANTIVNEIEPWTPGGRDVAMHKARQIPILAIDVGAEEGADAQLFTITGIRSVLIEGQRYVAFGVERV